MIASSLEPWQSRERAVLFPVSLNIWTPILNLEKARILQHANVQNCLLFRLCSSYFCQPVTRSMNEMFSWQFNLFCKLAHRLINDIAVVNPASLCHELCDRCICIENIYFVFIDAFSVILYFVFILQRRVTKQASCVSLHLYCVYLSLYCAAWPLKPLLVANVATLAVRPERTEVSWAQRN